MPKSEDEIKEGGVAISLDETEVQFYRLATKDNLADVRKLLIALAQGMSPHTTLRQAVCFLMIAQTAATGSRTSIGYMKSESEGEAFFDLLGTTTSRTVRSLKDAGLVFTVPSEFDRRELEIMMSPEGYALIDRAMDQIKEPHERKA